MAQKKSGYEVMLAEMLKSEQKRSKEWTEKLQELKKQAEQHSKEQQKDRQIMADFDSLSNKFIDAISRGDNTESRRILAQLSKIKARKQ